MIYIDYKPILALYRREDREDTKIVLTDSAYSEASYVYMDRADAPVINTLVWMQILDPDATNPINLNDENDYILEKWMWVDAVVCFDLAIQTNGVYDLDEWRTREGIVQVVLREHKHVLTRRLCLDDINIIDHFNLLIKDLNTTYSFLDDYINFLEWNGIQDLLFTENIKLDYLHPAADYPPVLPLNCPWKERPFSECLNNLLTNYDCRILERTAFPSDQAEKTAQKEYFLANGEHDVVAPEDVLTELVWTKRLPLELPTDIRFSRMVWPVHNDELEAQEITDQQYFGHNLFPEHGDTESYEANLEVLTDYINENHINYETYTEFETPRISKTFLTEYQWSKITYYPLSEKRFNVVHEVRPITGPLDDALSFENEIIAGVVMSVESGYVWLGNAMNVSTQTTYTDPIKVPADLPNSAKGHAIHAEVRLGEFLILTSKVIFTDKNYNFEGATDVMWDGDVVTKITHTATGINLTCPDSAIAFSLVPEEYNYLINYTVSNVSNANNVSLREFDVGNLVYYNTNVGTVDKYATITFSLIDQDPENIKTYLEATVSTSFYNRLSPTWLDDLATLWLANLTDITFYLRQSTHPYQCDWYAYFTTSAPTLNTFYTGIEPDLNPANFRGPETSDFATNFPHTFSTATTNIPAFYNEAGVLLKEVGEFNGMYIPFNFIGIKHLLWHKYYTYLRATAFTLGIEVA